MFRDEPSFQNWVYHVVYLLWDENRGMYPAGDGPKFDGLMTNGDKFGEFLDRFLGWKPNQHSKGSHTQMFEVMEKFNTDHEGVSVQDFVDCWYQIYEHYLGEFDKPAEISDFGEFDMEKQGEHFSEKMEEYGKPMAMEVMKFYKTRPKYLWTFTNSMVDMFLNESDYRNLCFSRIVCRWRDHHGSDDAILKSEDDLHGFFSGEMWPDASPELSRSFWRFVNCWQKDREGVSAKDFCGAWYCIHFGANKDFVGHHFDGMHPTWYSAEKVNVPIFTD